MKAPWYRVYINKSFTLLTAVASIVLDRLHLLWCTSFSKKKHTQKKIEIDVLLVKLDATIFRTLEAQLSPLLPWWQLCCWVYMYVHKDIHLYTHMRMLIYSTYLFVCSSRHMFLALYVEHQSPQASDKLHAPVGTLKE